MWSLHYYAAKFRSVNFSPKSNAKQSESTPKIRIWYPSAFPQINGELWKSSRNLVLQKGDHMAHVVPPVLSGRISTCGYLLQIECQTAGFRSV